MSKIIHAAAVSLLKSVLHFVHCLTVLLGRFRKCAWQQGLRCEDLYSDDRTMGTYCDSNVLIRLFGAD